MSSTDTAPIPVLGVIGTGHLASYTIAALMKSGHQGEILLSPRNAQVVADLSSRFGCRVMSDNASVVANADIILLSVRPDNALDALGELNLAADQVLMSAVAGFLVKELEAAATPATVVRIMPSSFIEHGDPFIPMFPDNAAVARLFGEQCPVVVFESEPAFDDSMIASCSYAWTLGLFQTLEQWFVGQGWSAELSREMVLRHVQGAVDVARSRPEVTPQTLLGEIATPGTYTRAGYEALHAAGGNQDWVAGLEKVKSMRDEN